MRQRHQQGSLRKKGRSWIGQWWENGSRKSRKLGLVSKMSKSQAQAGLEAILAPINKHQPVAEEVTFAMFVEESFLPFYKRKWKRSTAITVEDRVSNHLVAEFGTTTLAALTRDRLEAFLESKAKCGLSHSMVSHLRWDLKQILDLAVNDGLLKGKVNPAELLFVPQDATRYPKLVMALEDVRMALSVLELRERVIVGLAILAGLRPGEIFGLTWGRLDGQYADIQQRVYKGQIDTPKTDNSRRKVALSDRVVLDVARWKAVSLDTRPEAWVFPSETLRTPLVKENCWRRHIGPKLKAVGLGWVNFQVMRRTHASLLSDLGVEPKVVADQMGHTLDVNLNTYTQTGLERRREAVNVLDSALQVN